MSYLEHFNLTEQPFQLTPDPDFVYWSKQHARAKAYMESTILLSDGFVVITGEIGSGKTTLLQSFLQDLGDDVVYAVISQTQLSPTQFLQAALAEFGFKPFNKRKVELLDMFNMYLVEQYSKGKKVLLIIDEAQNLTRKVLEEIRLLSGIETQKEKVLRIILAGQPELRDTLDSGSLKQLVQRVRLRLHLIPLNRIEMAEYIEHRLAIAGYEGSRLFNDDCLATIFRYTGGVPRLTNTLCDSAMLCAFAENKKNVHLDDVKAAIEELGWQESEDGTGQLAKLAMITPSETGTLALGRLELRYQGETVRSYLLTSGRVIIGRTPDNDIYIKSKFVSRHHAQILTTMDECILEDLKSTNGVFLHDSRLQKHVLRDGDVVSVGTHELIYVDLRQSGLDNDDSVIDEQQA